MQRHHFDDKCPYSQSYSFSSTCMDVRVGPWRRLNTEESMLLNCGVGEDLRVPWTVRRSNQSFLKEMSPDYSVEGLVPKLKYFGHLRWRADSLKKTLMPGKAEGKRRRGQQRMRLLDSITNSVEMNLSNCRRQARREEPGVLQSMGSQRFGWTQLSKWTTQQHGQ